MLASCSDDDDADDGSATGRITPCELFTEADAASLLAGVDGIELLDPVELMAAGDGPIPAAGRDAAAEMCVYGTGPDQLAAVQLSEGLFSSVEQYRTAWEDDVEILDEPGLAAAHQAPDDDGVASADVLLNEDGDSLTLSVRGAAVSRSDLLAMLAALVERA